MADNHQQIETSKVLSSDKAALIKFSYSDSIYLLISAILFISFLQVLLLVIIRKTFNNTIIFGILLVSLFAYIIYRYILKFKQTIKAPESRKKALKSLIIVSCLFALFLVNAIRIFFTVILKLK